MNSDVSDLIQQVQWDLKMGVEQQLGSSAYETVLTRFSGSDSQLLVDLPQMLILPDFTFTFQTYLSGYISVPPPND